MALEMPSSLFEPEMHQSDARNRDRDKKNEQALIDDGWLVMTIRECELKEGLARFVELVRGTIEGRR
ncbi:MAG: hypothetical protein DRJ61_11440 [Acidobacteria bacterium]|nr:MAG: hypothetical protein DRJ61_11440 [Acidobacteriota bacterium]